METYSPQDGTVLTDLPTEKANAYGIHTINGLFINPYLSVGIGLGLDGYRNPRYNTFPAYIDIRGYLTDNAGSPYAVLNYGTLIEIENGPRNGNMFNFGLGYKIPINKERFIVIADIAYSYKAVSNDGESIRESNSYTRLKGAMLSIGVIF